MSGVFNGYIQESSFARGLIISCRSLVKVPNVVKFMAIYDLRIGLVAYPEWIETTTGVAYEEVPVFLLSPAMISINESILASSSGSGLSINE